MSSFCVTYVAAVLLGAASASNEDIANKYPCTDPLSSKMLSEAVDAALASLHGQNGWLHNLRQSTGYTHPIEVVSCPPEGSVWPWPSSEGAVGSLARVLNTGKLRVAGVKWAQGGAADYKTNPSAPTGFWPEYMKSVASVMSSHYGKTITVERVYYETSDLVNQAVAKGTDVDMSEPYYYLNGIHDSKPRIEALHFSCITVATASAFTSSKDSGINSMDALYDKITEGQSRKVGFIGEGNYDSVSHLLPSTIEPIYIREQSTLDVLLDNKTLLAYYISEAVASSSASRFVYETGVISPRVALFRKDSTDECVHSAALQAVQDSTDECVHSAALQAVQPETDEEKCDNAMLQMLLIILAAVVLLMATLLCLLICRERSGKPVFMAPLKDQPNANGQVYGSSY